VLLFFFRHSDDRAQQVFRVIINRLFLLFHFPKKNEQRAKIKVSRERNINQLSLQLFQQLKAIIWREYERVNKYSRSCVLFFVLRRNGGSRGRERLVKETCGVAERQLRSEDSWETEEAFRLLANLDNLPSQSLTTIHPTASHPFPH
jgi:hypothetical protein